MDTARDSAAAPVAANLQMQITEKNLRDLIDGKVIDIAVFGGVNLRMTLDKAVTRAVLISLGNMATRDIPVLSGSAGSATGLVSSIGSVGSVLSSRTELSGKETKP